MTHSSGEAPAPPFPLLGVPSPDPPMPLGPAPAEPLAAAPAPANPGHPIGIPSGPSGIPFLFAISFMISSGGRPNDCISCSSVTMCLKSVVSSSYAAMMARTLTSCAS